MMNTRTFEGSKVEPSITTSAAPVSSADVVRRLDRIEAKLDLLLSRRDSTLSRAEGRPIGGPSRIGGSPRIARFSLTMISCAPKKCRTEKLSATAHLPRCLP